MLREGKVIAAVDVGTSKTTVVIGKLNKLGKIEVLGCGKAPSHGGVIKGEVRNIDAIAKAIDEATANADVEVMIHEVYVNVSGKKFTAIDVEVKRNFEEEVEITKADVQEMLQEAFGVELNPDQRVYHIEPQGFVLDGEYMHDVVGMMASSLSTSYKLFVGNKNYAKNLGLAVAKSCLRVDRLVFDSLSTAESLLSIDEKEAGVALLEIGADLTKLSIYTDGVLRYHETLPFAGKIMTNDLKEECSIAAVQAEKLKITCGKAIADKTLKNTYISIPSYNGLKPREINMNMLAAILQSRLEEFADWTLATIERSGYADELRAGLVLAGGTAKLENISTLFKYKLGLDARVARPLLAEERFKDLQSPEYAAALGLLQIALYETHEELTEQQEEKKKSRKNNKTKEKQEASKNKDVPRNKNLVQKFFDRVSEQAELLFSEEESEELK